jgi:hypothetical protein
MLLKYVADKTIVLAQVNTRTIACEDSGCVLAAVLQDQQAIVEGLVDGLSTENAYDPAHAENHPTG